MYANFVIYNFGAFIACDAVQMTQNKYCSHLSMLHKQTVVHAVPPLCSAQPTLLMLGPSHTQDRLGASWLPLQLDK